MYVENPSPKDRVVVQKGDILTRLGKGELQPFQADASAGDVKCRFMLHTFKKDSGTAAAIAEKDAVILLKTASDVKLLSLEQAFKETAGDSAAIWGYRRQQERRGTRTVAPVAEVATAMEWKPEATGMADWSVENVGHLLSWPLEDWMVVFEFVANPRGELQPQNGMNVAAVVARKKIAIPCGRCLRIK